MSSDPVPVGPRRKRIFLVHDDEIEVVRRCGPWCCRPEPDDEAGGYPRRVRVAEVLLRRALPCRPEV